MKNIYKIVLFILVSFSFTNCDNSDGLNEGKFNANPESGWVEFLNSATSIQAKIDDLDLSQPAIVTIPIAVNVPVNKTDMTINYSFVPVSGEDPNNIFSNSGKVIAEAGKSSTYGNYYPEIQIDLAEAASISDIMIFDIVLTSTDRSSVTAGIEGSSRITSVRYQICPSLGSFVGTYTVTEGFTDGPYAGASLADIFGESYQVVLSAMPGDTTGTMFVINNSAGYDTYFLNGTVVTLDPCGGGALSFDDGYEDDIPVIALFREFAYTSSSNNFANHTITCSGPLDAFGGYQFILTKQ